MGFCEALGKKAHSQVCVFGRNTGFRQTVGLVQKSNSKPVTHTNAADTTSQNFWKYLHAAVWRKSVTGKVLNKLSELCA